MATATAKRVDGTATTRRYVFQVGRLVLAGYFLYNAINHFVNTPELAAYAASRGVPSPGAAVILAGILLAIGGLSILLGLWTGAGVAALATFLVVVTFSMHQFWEFRGMERVVEMANFAKNLALLGGVGMLLGVPTPWPFSLAERVSKRVRGLREAPAGAR